MLSLAPDLFNLYTSDIPKTANSSISIYTDDTAMLASDTDPILAFQTHLDLINIWAIQWRIKINPEKSFHALFSIYST